MKKKSFNCPAELTVSLLGGKWKVIVLWLLRNGAQRSGKLKSRLPGISPAAFSAAVRDLEACGLVKRSRRQSTMLEVSYTLTARGESLSPIVKSMVRWGLAHQAIYVEAEFRMADFYRNSGR